MSFIHSRWAFLCARGSSDWWSADYPRGTAFYNSNCSKPNGSASPFGEAQLDNTKLRSAAMAPGSCSRRNAPPRSRLGTAIQMLLGTPPNKGLPHRAMHEVQFPPQLPPSTPRDDDKFCMDSFLQAQASRPKPAGQREVEDHFDTYGRRHGLQPHPVCSFVPSWPKEWLPSLGLSSRFFFERILVTQGFLCISPGIALDKTPSTKRSLQLGVSPWVSSIYRVWC